MSEIHKLQEMSVEEYYQHLENSMRYAEELKKERESYNVGKEED